ncbi:MAG TPA: MFS transporter [Polyangia bacterium]|nr:MFS transporter [Polyangia bacterium]
MSLWPRSATIDAPRLLLTRALRGFADGLVSVLLAAHLSALGLSPFQIGAVLTGTLLGSAALTLLVGLRGHGWRRRTVLAGATLLMALTGLGLAASSAFVPILIIAVVGTLNPGAGDVTVFLPVEQAVLSESVAAPERTALFALYNLSGTFAGAFGALAAGGTGALAHALGWPVVAVGRAAFVAYAAVALVAALVYRTLSPAVEGALPGGTAAPLVRSRAIVLRLAALFSLDSAGGGLAVQSLLVLWLHRRFGLSLGTTGSVFFVMGLLAAGSQLVAVRLAGRIGLIRTMVFTHLPANLLLILAALVPTAPLAIACLLLRMALAQMDVPARQAYVMSVVPPEERAAAASVTNTPRSLAAALTPLLAGALLERTSFGWPLVLGGAMKAAYDLLLLAQFGRVEPRH